MADTCVILDDYQNVAHEFADWSRLGDEAHARATRLHLEGDELVAAVHDADVIVAMRERTVFDEALLSRLPRLKLLVTTGMSNASIDMDAAHCRGILVCGTRGLVGPAAELAWGLLLALQRQIPAEVANLRSGGQQWQLTVGHGLEGKVLGIVGLGKLGQRVAAYGIAFKMRVLGWSRNNSPERCAALGIEFAPTLNALLAEADAVSLHVTLTPQTRGMIGSHELGLMKRDAVIVNTSRGPLVDETALIEALAGKAIRGAALDVFEREPLPADHPFRTLPNVLATPHIGYVTRETYQVYFNDVVENIAAWQAGNPLRVINRPV